MSKHRRAAIEVTANASSSPIKAVRFTRQLWLEQPFPDNYTDDSFLSSLRVSMHVPTRSYWQIVRDSTAVTQQVDTVALVAAVSVYLYKGWMSPLPLLSLVVVPLVMAGYYCLVAGKQSHQHIARRAFRQVALLTAGVYLMSPLLQTLTRSVSSDSIVALVCGLLVVHLYLHDYTFVDRVTDSLTGSMSLTAATFASVLIASQLNSQLQVFAQVLFSLEFYLLSPYARRYVKTRSAAADQALTVAMHMTVFVLIVSFSAPVASVYVLLLYFLTFICPLCLLRVQKYKAQVNGPWDEAVPSVSLKKFTKVSVLTCK